MRVFLLALLVGCSPVTPATPITIARADTVALGDGVTCVFLTLGDGRHATLAGQHPRCAAAYQAWVSK